jgi:hypothetical protein
LAAKPEVAWMKGNTVSGLTIMSAIPPVFEAYATLELPWTGDHEPSSPEDWEQVDGDRERHDASVLAVLSEHSDQQPWWLGYLETGGGEIPFERGPKVRLYAGWSYVLIEAGPEEAGAWRIEPQGKGVLPDLMFPADRSWLFSTLWDDDWTCIGGSRQLVDAFLVNPDLRPRVREVNPSIKDATPPGHTAL